MPGSPGATADLPRSGQGGHRRSSCLPCLLHPAGKHKNSFCCCYVAPHTLQIEETEAEEMPGLSYLEGIQKGKGRLEEPLIRCNFTVVRDLCGRCHALPAMQHCGALVSQKAVE